MKWMGLNEIREKFLAFFESKGHLRASSAPLVPQNDNSLLLINSGMAPLKPYFTGQVTPPKSRMTTCQKCIRTPDIDRVGKTARHGTFFEMLGNFSFGDYFKREAIRYAWEFLTQVMEIPPQRLYVSVYEHDDEAEQIWQEEIGLTPDRITRLGKEDNFWEIGTGPCGPCSEIYFDRGEKYGCGKPECGVGCDCDRYVEIWNLVFSQFNSDGQGNYSDLAQKNIDTGMGLERLAVAMQDVDNLFEVDTIRAIIDKVCEICGKPYVAGSEQSVSMRVITDHIRSAMFMISDGVLPANEGRGYVLRRLIRRAARHGKLLGIEGLFLTKVCQAAIAQSEGAYPELAEKREYILKVLNLEEERFQKTIDQGLSILAEMIGKAKEKTLSAADAFKLHDTFGFPLDLTREILEERGMQVDEAGFLALMRDQKERARAARAGADTSWNKDYAQIRDLPATQFVGYDTLSAQAEILALFAEGELAEMAGEGQEAVFVLDTTPFYAESGGQVGDRGCIDKDGAKARVIDCQKSADGKYIHIAQIIEGTFLRGDRVNAAVCRETRAATMRGHSSLHLLQSALRKVLGDHVVQAGSYVDAHRARFDFSHFAAMSKEEIKQVELEVNRAILAGMDVVVQQMPIEQAKKLGAMALFGEKYGDMVRVVRMGDYSSEFCGGTHVVNTAHIGLFKILSESSVAAGVRRIEAVTGLNVLAVLEQRDALLADAAARLKAQPDEISVKIGQLQEEVREAHRQIERMSAASAGAKADSLLAGAKQVDGIDLIVSCEKGANMDTLRKMTDTLKEKNPNVVALLAAPGEGKVTFQAACGKSAVQKGAHAGKLVSQIAALCGGRGGGRPDSASAGGKQVDKVDQALASARQIVADMLQKG